MSGKAILIGLDAAVPTLLEEYVRDGHLPNISRLLALGSYARAHSVFPGITPVNWATIATGAYPGTHGITDFLIHESGEPLDSFRNAFRSNELKAETLWQTAERNGLKVATINFPGSWPAASR
ncbi:MAG: alkaline phosphatase family protein, partial [Firmicutes bacterium]|nr:alkaline phosphatase family protein [Bacillota bacterium]